MKNIRAIALTAIILCTAMASHAQNMNSFFEKFRKEESVKLWEEQNKETEKNWKEYYEYRDKCNEEYARILKEAWDSVSVIKSEPVKEEKTLPPVVYDGPKEEYTVKTLTKAAEEETNFLAIFKEAKPLKGIFERKKEEVSEDEFSFVFYGTDLSVRICKKMPKLKNSSALAVAGVWKELSDKKHNNMIVDCLRIKEERGLCDWAYLKMLQNMSAAYYSNSNNDATMLTAFILAQSGYKIRLANNGEKLMLLFASEYAFTESPYYIIIKGDKFHFANTEDSNSDIKLLPEKLCVSNASLENEAQVSMAINRHMKFDMDSSHTKVMYSRLYPQLKKGVRVNNNLINFYGSYPRTRLGTGYSWISYANTPLSKEAEESLYPIIRELVEGKDTSVALTIINDLVQSSFDTKSDNDVWGHDRIFFAEEGLYYPSGDCEDRAILFTRIVRDILNYETVLLYYPGHLACGVKVKEYIPGDYVYCGDDEYLICDPGFVNAGIGKVVPQVKGEKVKVIRLD